MQELWRPVHGHESDYLVSSLGRVYSLNSRKMLSLSWLDGRYLACTIKRKMRKVHHLVAEAFICPRPAEMLCLHKDDNKANNTPDNLYWGTAKQNQHDCIRNGHRQDQAGTANNNAKLNCEMVKQIRDAKGTCASIGHQFGCSPMSVSLIKRRKLWAHCA